MVSNSSKERDGMKMKNYPDQLTILYHDRMEELTNDSYPDEYQRDRQKFADLYDEIKDALPEDKAHLMMDLESTHASLTGITEETGYRLGFGDAFRLAATAFAGKV